MKRSEISPTSHDELEVVQRLIDDQNASIMESVFRMFEPPPRLTISEWAEKYAYLSPEDSAEPGKYHCSRAPYQREMMDAVSDPEIEEVSYKTSSQVGKTQIAKAIIGYYMQQDPGPILLVMPNEKMVRSFSKDRLTPMLRDTPVLRELVRQARAKNSSNEILHKTFPGGHFTGVSAGTASDLVSRPIRILIFDEKDKYKSSAGYSGDPSEMAKTRTKTFFNRKIINISTPEIEGASPISADFDRSDQRYNYVPCIRCGFPQRLYFANMKWDKAAAVDVLPDRVWYECEQCHAKLEESDRMKMVTAGEWRPTYPERRRHAGFFLWELYSPWSSMLAIAHKFIAARRSNNPEILKQVVNEVFGEVWRYVQETKINESDLLKRRDEYTDVPEGAYILTAGVDVQGDRIEVGIDAWGPGEQSWMIDHQILPGSPERADVWGLLENYLLGSWKHESGVMMNIECCFVDSGNFTDYVYGYTKPRTGRRIFASKGSSQEKAPIVGKPSTNNRARALLFPIGTDVAKTVIMSRLKIEDRGAGYMHFNQKADENYFSQLTAERLKTWLAKGRLNRKWVKVRERNEVLDVKVMNLAAILYLNPNWELVKTNFESLADASPSVPAEESDKLKVQSEIRTRDPFLPATGPRRKNFVHGW